MGSEFDLRESLALVLIQLSERETRNAAWEWLKAHLAEILGRMRADEAARLLGSLAGAFCNAPMRAEAEALVTRHVPTTDGSKSEVASGLEESAQCITEQKRTLPALERYLNRK